MAFAREKKCEKFFAFSRFQNCDKPVCTSNYSTVSQFLMAVLKVVSFMDSWLCAAWFHTFYIHSTLGEQKNEKNAKAWTAYSKVGFA